MAALCLVEGWERFEVGAMPQVEREEQRVPKPGREAPSFGAGIEGRQIVLGILSNT